MNKILLFIYFVVLIYSCSSDNTELLLEEQTVKEGVYAGDNQWIYEQMNHYYLWREDLPDSLSCDYTTDPVTFYKALLSSKDRFSYCTRNTYYTSSVEPLDYGFAYQVYKSIKGENLLQVLYVTSENLRKQKLGRGDWLHKVPTFGSSLSFARGKVKNGAFQPLDTLTVEPILWGQQRNTVYLDSIYSVGSSKVGYLCYLEFDNIKDLETPIKKFYDAHVDELILDLRYNPGGYVRTCRYLCNSIVPDEGYGKIFQQCTYNDRVSEEYLKEFGSRTTKEYYEVPTNGNGQILGSEIYGLKLKRLYILTSKNTASASEATIVCLRPFMNITVIGEQTYGKGVSSWTISERQYKYELHPIIMQYYNASMETTPSDGIPADVEIAGGYDTVKKELGDRNEPLLAAALRSIEMDGSSTVIVEGITRAEYSELMPIGEPSFFHKIKTEY